MGDLAGIEAREWQRLQMFFAKAAEWRDTRRAVNAYIRYSLHPLKRLTIQVSDIHKMEADSKLCWT